jgi:hypothetical protein
LCEPHLHGVLHFGDDGGMNEPTSPSAQLDQTQPGKKDASARWRKLLEDQRASGLPISAFCRERGIPASSLFAWRRRLASGAQVFKPVKIAATPTPPRRRGGDDGDDGDDGGEGAIELYLPGAGARRLIVRRGFDRQLLADVIDALESLA